MYSRATDVAHGPARRFRSNRSLKHRTSRYDVGCMPFGLSCDLFRTWSLFELDAVLLGEINYYLIQSVGPKGGSHVC